MMTSRSMAVNLMHDGETHAALLFNYNAMPSATCRHFEGISSFHSNRVSSIIKSNVLDVMLRLS